MEPGKIQVARKPVSIADFGLPISNPTGQYQRTGQQFPEQWSVIPGIRSELSSATLVNITSPNSQHGQAVAKHSGDAIAQLTVMLDKPCGARWRTLAGVAAVICVLALIQLLIHTRSHPGQSQLLVLLCAGPVMLGMLRMNLSVAATGFPPSKYEFWPFADWRVTVIYALCFIAVVLIADGNGHEHSRRSRPRSTLVVDNAEVCDRGCIASNEGLYPRTFG